MEKQEFRKATEDDHGANVWFGDLCQECGAPNIQQGTTQGPYYGDSHGGYVWKLVQHSCTKNLKERIEKLEEIINKTLTSKH